MITKLRLPKLPYAEQAINGPLVTQSIRKQELNEEFTDALSVCSCHPEKKSNSTTSSQSLEYQAKVNLSGNLPDDSLSTNEAGKYYANPAMLPNHLKKTYEGESMTRLFEPPKESQGTGASGKKDDGGKLRYDLLPWKAVEGVVRVLTFGAKKYSPNGWRTVPNAKERYTAALLRHLVALQKGESTDPESGLKHIDHLLCNAVFLSELED